MEHDVLRVPYVLKKFHKEVPVCCAQKSCLAQRIQDWLSTFSTGGLQGLELPDACARGEAEGPLDNSSVKGCCC